MVALSIEGQVLDWKGPSYERWELLQELVWDRLSAAGVCSKLHAMTSSATTKVAVIRPCNTPSCCHPIQYIRDVWQIYWQIRIQDDEEHFYSQSIEGKKTLRLILTKIGQLVCQVMKILGFSKFQICFCTLYVCIV